MRHTSADIEKFPNKHSLADDSSVPPRPYPANKERAVNQADSAPRQNESAIQPRLLEKTAASLDADYLSSLGSKEKGEGATEKSHLRRATSGEGEARQKAKRDFQK